MLRGIERLAKDMSAKIVKQELVANNLANATTPGFKTQRAFRSMLEASVGRTGNDRDAGTIETYTSFSQGPIEQTHRDLDVAINGEGFFVVDTPYGERYTRSGSFTLASGGLLATQSGDLVLGAGGPIPISGSNLSITPDGKVVVDGDEVDTLRVVTFDSPERLVREGNMYAAESQSAVDADMTRTELIHGALERSNVSPVDEMVEMISIHRSFEAAQRGIRLQDESARRLIERSGGSGS
jgi:flagellar basal-body rod protein FlgF